MRYSKIYMVNPEYADELKIIKNKEYMKQLGLSPEFLTRMFNQKRNLKLSTAKCFISLAYNISVRDNEQMKELLDRHFIEVEK